MQMKRAAYIFVCLAVLLTAGKDNGAALDTDAIVQAAVTYYRGNASVSTVEMIVHRPNWQRAYTIKAWTRGQKDSLFTILAPSRDQGNGTLKRGREMWTYNPKVNRVIKLPPSMMSQAWMGSDFSNNDLAKSDSILEDYDHEAAGTETHDGKKVYVISARPKSNAPVIWGMQKLKIREDYILLCQEFYDEDLRLVKAMTGEQIQPLGGKLFPKVWKMQKADRPQAYTVLDYRELVFHDDLSDSIFSLSSLKQPRR